MTKVIFGFSRPKKWKPLAALIMKLTNCPYSHVYIKLWSEKYQRHLIYQASSTAVNFMNDVIFNDQNSTIKEFEITVPVNVCNEVMRFAIDNCGRSYGMKELLGLGYVQFMAIFGIQTKNPWRNTNTFICSGLAAELLIALGYNLEQDPNDMTPKDIYEWLESEH